MLAGSRRFVQKSSRRYLYNVLNTHTWSKWFQNITTCLKPIKHNLNYFLKLSFYFIHFSPIVPFILRILNLHSLACFHLDDPSFNNSFNSSPAWNDLSHLKPISFLFFCNYPFRYHPMVHSQHYVIPEVNDKNPNSLWNLDKSDFPLNSANTSLLKNKQTLYSYSASEKVKELLVVKFLFFDIVTIIHICD